MDQFRGPRAHDLLADGQQFGDYEIIATAGVGGMGVVYRARQRSLRRLIALKVIRGEIALATEYRARFLREAQMAASIVHPNVVSIYDVGERNDQLFLAMQWVEGPDLKRVLRDSGRLLPERAIRAAVQVASALDAVHSVAGLIHRDVKPANVLLGQVGTQDHVYLTDFGVAKASENEDHLTRTGWLVGTDGYLSPEQIRGSEPTARSDLYALGCLFFEALTGYPPFVAENDMALRWAHANDPRPTASAIIPALGTRFDGFFARALAVDPSDRFSSGSEFAAALEHPHGGEAAATEALVVPRTPTVIGPRPVFPERVSSDPRTPPPPYPPDGYATPPPAQSAQGRPGSPLVLVLLAALAVVGIVVGGLAAGGVFSKEDALRVAAVPRQPPESATTQFGKAARTRPARRTEPRTESVATDAVTTAQFHSSTAGPSVSTTTPETADSGTDQALSAQTPPSGEYSILVPNDWSYQQDGSSDVWSSPVPNEELDVLTSDCSACVLNGMTPNPQGAGVPDGTFSTTKLNPYALAFEADTSGNPFPDNGVDVVTTSDSTITGYAQVDLWLPSSSHAEATKILNSFSLLKATNS